MEACYDYCYCYYYYYYYYYYYCYCYCYYNSKTSRYIFFYKFTSN